MTIEKSNIADQICKKITSEIGTMYFFDHIVVAEFNEGIHVDFDSATLLLEDLVKYFGQSRPFGLIANRVNSYSISLLDAQEVKGALPNLAAYAVISHNEAGKMNAEIENSFCESNDISFDNLYEGVDWVYQMVKEQITISLN